MTSRKEIGDTRQLDILKLVFEQNLSSEQQDKLIELLEGDETIWETTGHQAFCDKVNGLIAEWKAGNIKNK